MRIGPGTLIVENVNGDVISKCEVGDVIFSRDGDTTASVMNSLSYDDLLDGMDRINMNHVIVWTNFGLNRKWKKSKRYFPRKGGKRIKK